MRDARVGGVKTAALAIDAAGNAKWSGTETTGASAYDTAAVSHSDTFTATGTVTYSYFTTGNCSGTAADTATVTLAADGSVPNSISEGHLWTPVSLYYPTYSSAYN